MPVPSSSPASNGTLTEKVDAEGRSPRIASAPSTSRMAREEPEPCHCGTTTKAAGTLLASRYRLGGTTGTKLEGSEASLDLGLLVQILKALELSVEA